jgi:hypothetical protein
MKTGRNDPCLCGSGNKYKKCCLPLEDEQRRDAAQQRLWEDEEQFDDSTSEDDDPVDIPPLDVNEIRRVTYERGFAKSLKSAVSGRGLKTSAWVAPAIPRPILDSIEREALEELAGGWGNPRAGDPIQVDMIELETDTGLIAVEVFNRGTLLAYEDSDEVRRIHRVCGMMEHAAEPAEHDEAEATTRGEPTLTPRFGLEEAMKLHRRQGGTCELCDESLTWPGAKRHFAACAPEHDAKKGDSQKLVHLRITAPHRPGYWLDVEVRDDARLEAIDRFLRNTWLECCGHLSRFDVRGIQYVSAGLEPGGWSMPGGSFGAARTERSMNARVRDAMPAPGGRFAYEYDFGSSTNLLITVAGERSGRIGRASVRLLGRNTPLGWPCAFCGAPATEICPFCIHDAENPFVCSVHATDGHTCGEDGFLPVVNSPRMGVCGYTGEF